MKKYFYQNTISGLNRVLTEELFWKMMDSLSPRLVFERRGQKIWVAGASNEFVLIERSFVYAE